jgi:predicted dehydrogenase
MRAIVVGAGGISNAWFAPLKAEGVEVAAVIDLDPRRAEAQIAKYALSAAVADTDLDRVLTGVKADFLVDLTVPEAHCPVTCKALEAALHVIGEKPMAASLDQARRMVETSRRTGRMYMVSQSRRWEDSTVALKQAIAHIGDLTALHCDFFIGAHFGGFRDAMPSPLILDMAIHHFDLARFFGGLDPVSVYAEEFNPHGSWYAGAAAAHCLFQMDSSVRFTYRGSWCAEGCPTPWNGAWRAIGTKGTAQLTNDGVHAEVVKGERQEGEFHRAIETLDLPPVKLEKVTQRGALAEMMEFLRTGKKPQTECTDNVKSLAMVFGAVESSKQGRRILI